MTPEQFAQAAQAKAFEILTPADPPTTPSIGAFKLSEPLVLRQAPNGGWVISQPGRMGDRDNEIGAYSTTRDMIVALSGALGGLVAA